MKNSVLFVTIILLFSSGKLYASEISISDFLKSIQNDVDIQYQKSKIQVLKNASMNTPFVNEVEFRTKSDEFDLQKQRYSVRVSPNGWEEAEYGKKTYYSRLKFVDAEYETITNRALKKRYNLIVDLLFKKSIFEMSKKLMVIYEDKLNVLRQSKENLDFAADKLIDAEDKYLKLQLQLINLENDINEYEEEIKYLAHLNESFTFSNKNLVDIEFISNFLKDFNPILNIDHIHLKKSQLSVELANSRYKLEIAENRDFISFFEASYTNNKNGLIKEMIGINFGIRLPYITRKNLDINRRKLTYLKEKNDYDSILRKVPKKVKTLSMDLQRLVDQHKILSAKTKESNAESYFKKFLEVDGVSPLILLKLKESMLNSEMLILKINHRVLERYIMLLDISGKLLEKPLKNYLVKNLESIE